MDTETRQTPENTEETTRMPGSRRSKHRFTSRKQDMQTEGTPACKQKMQQELLGYKRLAGLVATSMEPNAETNSTGGQQAPGSSSPLQSAPADKQQEDVESGRRGQETAQPGCCLKWCGKCLSCPRACWKYYCPWCQDDDPPEYNTWCMFFKVMFKRPTTFLTTAAGILSLVQGALAGTSASSQTVSLVLGLVAGILGLLATAFVHGTDQENNTLNRKNITLKGKNETLAGQNGELKADNQKRELQLQERLKALKRSLGRRMALLSSAGTPAEAAGSLQHQDEIEFLERILDDNTNPASNSTNVAAR